MPVNVVYGIVAIRAFVIVEKIDFAVVERGGFGFLPQPQTSRTAANRVRQILRMVFPLFNATVDGFANEGLHFGKCAGLFGGGRRFPDDGVEFGRKFLMSSDLSSIHLTSSTLSMFMFSPQNRQ